MSAFYYVSGVVVTTASPAYFQIMEEDGPDQTCIAMVPFNNNINPASDAGYYRAERDAKLIATALNAFFEDATDAAARASRGGDL
jgi:hypothetical protein